MSAQSDSEVGQADLKRQDFLQVVTFNLSQEQYAVEISSVKEIILVEGITKVPQMPAYIEGIINLRGNVIPVIDLRKRFDLTVHDLDEETRIVVTRMQEKIVGIIVDSVSQVIKIPHENIQPPPETVASIAGDYLADIAKVDDSMIMLLDVKLILNAEENQELKSA